MGRWKERERREMEEVAERERREMEEAGEREEKKRRIKMGEFGGQVKKASSFAAPMVAATVMQYLLQVVSVMMVGHLGDQLSLSSVAIATSFTNVTGFSVLSGLAGGLETLCGQAFGAEQYHKLGKYTSTAIISLFLACPPISLLWIFMDKFLPLFGQDPLICHKARTYSLYLIPALFGGAILKPLTRHFQCQTLIFPLLSSSFAVLCFHVPLSWVLVYKLGVGSVGAAISMSICTWLNLVFLGFYMFFSSKGKKTRVVFSTDAFAGVMEFFRFALPSAVMVCLKWWCMELIALLSGLLPNPKLEASVLSICLTISTLHFTIPYAFGAAASLGIGLASPVVLNVHSTRVSNELGRGEEEVARLAAWAAMSMALSEAVIVSVGLFLCRHVVSYAFSSDEEVVSHVAVIAPWLCISIFTDSLQAVLSGVAKGSGWQSKGAYINIGAFYLVGLPVSVVLGFVFHLKGEGLWIGIVIGSILQSFLLILITCRTNWKNQANRARERIFEEKEGEGEIAPLSL